MWTAKIKYTAHDFRGWGTISKSVLLRHFFSNIATAQVSSTRWSSWLALRSHIIWGKKKQPTLSFHHRFALHPVWGCAAQWERLVGSRETASPCLPPLPFLQPHCAFQFCLQGSLLSFYLFPAWSMLESTWIMIWCSSHLPNIGVTYTHRNFLNFFFSPDPTIAPRSTKKYESSRFLSFPLTIGTENFRAFMLCSQLPSLKFWHSPSDPVFFWEVV